MCRYESPPPQAGERGKPARLLQAKASAEFVEGALFYGFLGSICIAVISTDAEYMENLSYERHHIRSAKVNFNQCFPQMTKRIYEEDLRFIAQTPEQSCPWESGELIISREIMHIETGGDIFQQTGLCILKPA